MTSIAGGLIKGTHHLGWALVVLGAVAALAPIAFGATIIVVIGLVLLVAAALIGLWGARAREAGRGSAGLVVAALTAIAGLVLVVQPTTGLELVRWLLIAYFVLSGVAEILHGTSMLPSGVVSILMGAALWADWPISGARAIGIFVGVKLASVGAAIVRVSRGLDAVGDRLTAARERLR